MRSDRSLSPDYFEGIFRGDNDPWGLQSRPYETAKFARTIEALSGRRYDRGFEVGCAGGMLTRQLAPQCGHLLAIDVSETALERAAGRCADVRNVDFRRMVFPRETPDPGGFDLILLSEVAYYWDDADLARAGDWMRGNLRPSGDLLLVHWIGETDYPQTGDGAVEALAMQFGGFVQGVIQERHSRYRLDLWRRA